MKDPVFSLLSQQEWAYKLGDVMVSLSFTCLCLLLIFHRHRYLLFRRLLFILSLLNSLRSMMILMTRLPSSYSDNELRCRPRVENRTAWLLVERTWEQAIRLGLQNDSQRMLCGDQFFSGHTAMMTISALCWTYYVPKKWHLASYAPKLFALVGIPCLVFSRTHYSCDVLVGYCISAIIFVLYHAICDIESVDVRQQSVINRTFLIAKLIHWFERRMPLGRLTNQFEIPLLDKLTTHCGMWRKMKGGKGGEAQAGAAKKTKKKSDKQHSRESSDGTTQSDRSTAIFFVHRP